MGQLELVPVLVQIDLMGRRGPQIIIEPYSHIGRTAVKRHRLDVRNDVPTGVVVGPDGDPNKFPTQVGIIIRMVSRLELARFGKVSSRGRAKVGKK